MLCFGFVISDADDLEEGGVIPYMRTLLLIFANVNTGLMVVWVRYTSRRNVNFHYINLAFDIR